jgi:hypothetical protein
MTGKTKSSMTVDDALRVAAIFEADDVIAVPALACRILANYIRELEARTVKEINDVETQLQSNKEPLL